MLVIGGTGWLYGGLVGALAFKIAQEVFSSLTPQYWHFWMGLVLVVLVLIGRDRMSIGRSGLAGWIARRARGVRALDVTLALETVDLCKAFGGLTATNDVSFRLAAGARHALIGPNGAGKTTLVNLLAGRSHPRPVACCSKATTSPTSRWTAASAAGSAARSRSISSSAR